MIEIKFKAFVSIQKGEPRCFDYKTGEEYPWVDAIESDVLVKDLQFTGLHDKHGKEIYEGDILSMHNGQYKTVVEFTDYGYQGLHKESGTHEPLTTFLEDHEIIGNIYSNPELLN